MLASLMWWRQHGSLGFDLSPRRKAPADQNRRYLLGLLKHGALAKGTGGREGGTLTEEVCDTAARAGTGRTRRFGTLRSFATSGGSVWHTGSALWFNLQPLCSGTGMIPLITGNAAALRETPRALHPQRSPRQAATAGHGQPGLRDMCHRIIIIESQKDLAWKGP